MGRYLLLALVLYAAVSTAQPVLTDVAQDVGVDHVALMANPVMTAQGGAAWFDYDQDGFYDLYLTGGGYPDLLYRNMGDGTFTDVTQQSGISAIQAVATDGVTTGDVNNDGYPEVFVTTLKEDPNWLFMNNGDGTFSNLIGWEGISDSANSFSAAFGDLNMDGFLDLYVCNWSPGMDLIEPFPGIFMIEAVRNFYYQNNGDGTFSEMAAYYGIDDTTGCSLGVLITDFDNDNDPDLFVANDFGQFDGNNENALYRNDHPINTLTDVSVQTGADIGMNGMGMAKGDIDEDGDLDYYISNVGHDKMLRNNNGVFEDILENVGMGNDSVWFLNLDGQMLNFGWGVGLMDIDNDMDLDCFVANGDIEYEYPRPCLDSNKLFLNDFANGTFHDISVATGVAYPYVSRALAYCDYDLDGDLDVFVGVTDSVGGSARSMLYRNDSPAQHWLEVKATGVQNNRDGVSAKVLVHFNGHTLLREIGGGSSFDSQDWNVAHFGLGGTSVIDSMDVIWPGGGLDRYYNINSGQFIEAVEGQGLVTAVETQKMMLNISPNPFSDNVDISINAPSFSLRLYNSQGQLILSRKSTSSNMKLSLARLTPGMYYLCIRTDSAFVRRKLVKR